MTIPCEIPRSWDSQSNEPWNVLWCPISGAFSLEGAEAGHTAWLKAVSAQLTGLQFLTEADLGTLPVNSQHHPAILYLHIKHQHLTSTSTVPNFGQHRRQARTDATFSWSIGTYSPSHRELLHRMADPFEVRMRFSSQLQHLNASVTSAQKAAQYALKYKDMSEDLHSCILEQLERVSLLPASSILLGSWDGLITDL